MPTDLEQCLAANRVLADEKEALQALLSKITDAKRQVAVVNQSSLASDDELLAIVQALQHQVSEQLMPAWGMDATMLLVRKGFAVPPGAWQIVVKDDPGQPGVLGYHFDTSAGIPVSEVYVSIVRQYGTLLSLVLSHENTEMLTDPYLHAYFDPSDGSGLRFGETCDQMNLRGFEYPIGSGIYLHDFVFPSWFLAGSKGPYCQSGLMFGSASGYVKAPLELAYQGYIGILQNGTTQLVKNGPALAPKPLGRTRIRMKRHHRSVLRRILLR